MNENAFVRVEIGLDGGQILSTLVTPASAEALERSLNAGAAGALALEAQEGSILLGKDRKAVERPRPDELLWMLHVPEQDLQDALRRSVGVQSKSGRPYPCLHFGR